MTCGRRLPASMQQKGVEQPKVVEQPRAVRLLDCGHDHDYIML